MGHKTWSIRKRISESETESQRFTEQTKVPGSWGLFAFPLSRHLLRTLVIVYSLLKIPGCHSLGLDVFRAAYQEKLLTLMVSQDGTCNPGRRVSSLKFLSRSRVWTFLRAEQLRVIRAFVEDWIVCHHSLTSPSHCPSQRHQTNKQTNQPKTEKPPPWLNTLEKYLEREDLF